MENFVLKSIKLYQRTLSPDHGPFFTNSGLRCRFYPSCSQYFYEVIEKYGLGRGTIMGLWRILRCSPLSKGGLDLVKF